MNATQFDTREFRNALGNFATGVTIITTRSAEGEPVGLTANSFNSVSLEPPLILWSLAKTAASVPIFDTAEYWNVHILSVDQEPLSNLFASRGADKFADIELDEGVTDAPLIPGGTARLQCRNAFQYDGGDHIIFVGEVLAFDTTGNPPLAFLGGQYALTTRKPYEGLQLSEGDGLSAHYNENLLGYLLGRAHFQMIEQLALGSAEPPISEQEFYILSTLLIQDDITIDELNSYLQHSEAALALSDLDNMANQGWVAIEGDTQHIKLAHDGRTMIVTQIANAKSIEQRIAQTLGEGDVMALKLLLKKIIHATDHGTPDLWSSHD